jgi:hypothetical protein
MIEAGAQAIQRVVANRTGRGKDWSELPETKRESYREEFKAAFADAMRVAR